MEVVGRQGEHLATQMPAGVKAEQIADTQHHQLYRLSPDDPQLVHETSPASHAYRSQRSSIHQYSGQYSPIDDPGLTYSPTTSIESAGYEQQRHTGAAAVDYYPTYERHVPVESQTGTSYSACTCLSNQASHPTLLSLSNQLQSSLDLLKRLPEHNTRHHCGLIKRISELDSTIQYVISP